jgi:hypothetical protein
MCKALIIVVCVLFVLFMKTLQKCGAEIFSVEKNAIVHSSIGLSKIRVEDK